MEISKEDDNSCLIKLKYPQSQSSLITSSPRIRTRSSEKPSNNKENVYSNNVEVPNLGMKPMQMKSRRKGGGYNLRKSLAWDTAFFTDEGILDPLELTLITGINANTSRGELATISEQGNSSDSNFGNEYDDAEPSEEALCKESHDTTRTSRGNRKKTDSSLGNHDSSPHPKVTHKVLSVNRTKRAGSKVGGCSEPLTAASLKRPANSSIMRTAKKESKLPKIPISKPEPCLSAMTKGSIAPSHLRHNLIPKPTIDAKKNVAFKSYAKNVHDSQSKAKKSSGSVHLPTKELAKRTIRDLTKKSSSKATSSTKSCLVRADRSNSGSDMLPDRLQLCKCEEESEPLAASNLAQQTTTNADNSLPDAARSISSGHCHNQRASNGPMISNRLHSFKSQEHPAALVPHNVNPNNAGVPSHIQPAGPSGLRLPSPSLRFFDQKTTSECGSLKQKEFEQLNTNMGSNRKIGELRPPAVSARTPMKINDIKENPCSAPSTLSTPSGSTQLSLSPKHVENTTNVVPVSNIYNNLARKMVDIEVQYEDRGSELESPKGVEQDKRSFGREEIKENEKISHSTVQLGEGIGATIHLSQNAGFNEVGVGTLQLMPEGNDERVPFFPETKDKRVLHIEEDRLHSYTAISMLKSPQSVQHEEHNLSTISTNFREDIAQVSGEQSHIEKSDALKVNSKSCFDACSLEAEDWVSEVLVDSLKDQIGKREDNVGPDLERHSSVLQHENIGQENDVAKAVDNKNIPMNDDARWNTDSPCGGTTGRISITSRDFIMDIAQTSREQSETEKSDAPKVNPGSQLGVGSLEAEDRVGEVFVDLQDESGKKEDNVGAGLKNSAVLQDENVGQDKDVAKAVVGKSLTMNFDARWNTDCPCSGTKERISITSIDFMQDLAQTSGEQSDAEKSDAPMVNSESHPDNGSLEAEDWVSQVFVDSQTDHTGKREDDAYVGLVKYSAVLQRETIGQEDDVAKAVDDKSLPMNYDARWYTDSPGSGTTGKISITPRESPKDEGENGGNTVATKSRYQFHSEGPSVSCIMPSESSALDKGPYTNATEIFQEKSGSSYLGAVFLEVPDEKQDVKPLAKDLEYREAAPLIDDHKHFSLLCPRPGVELLSGTASLGDAESILQFAQYGSTYLMNLEKEGLDIIPAATEAEHQVHEDQKNQVMGIITGSFSEESVVAENSRHSHDNILEANPIVQITERSVAINNFSKTHVEDSQLHDVEMLVQSCSTLTSELHCHSKQDVDHSDVYGKQPELSSTAIELENVSRSNQLLNHTINFQQEYIIKAVKDVVGQSDAYDCDPKPSNIDAPTPTLGQEVGFLRNGEGQPCVESVTSGSTVIDSAANYDGNCNGRRLKECADLLLEFESSGKDKMFGVDITRMGYYSPLEEPCSFPREIVDSMLQEKETLFAQLAEIEQVSADYDGVFMYSSSSKKISNSNKANNALDSVTSEQSISYGCNVQTSCATVQNLPLVQVNVSDVTGGNKPNEPQGLDEIMPLMDTSDPFTNGQSNSSFTVSQQPNTGVTTTCTTVCSVTAELCSDAGRDDSMLTSTYRIGDEGSKVNIGDEIDAGVLQEGKISMADELHHDLDSGGDLKRNKDTTVLSKKPNDIKRRDNSLVIHPPNAVPFSDEWLAAIEAAGEEILTMKCGAVQHSPPDKSLPEPSPWSPVKKKVNQIGPYDCTKYTNAMPSNPH